MEYARGMYSFEEADKAPRRAAVWEIRVGDRTRKDMGDIGALAASINRVGLLHSIAVTADLRLVAGARRLEAVKKLGWQSVSITVVQGLDDALGLLLAERDENECRKGFTLSESVAMGETLEEVEKEEAKKRQGRPGQERCGKLPQQEPVGKTRDKVGAALGMSGRTYEKAKAVVEAAEADPEKFAPIVEEMDRTGKVNGAYRQAQEIRRRELLEETGLTEEDIAIKELPNETVVALVLRMQPWLLGLERQWPMPSMVERMSSAGLVDALAAVRSVRTHLSKWEGWVEAEVARRKERKP